MCQIHSIVYMATAVAGEDQRDYTGLTAQTFKQRFNSHQQSFRDKKYQSSTALSKHIWSLKEKYTNFEIKWEVQKKATEYQNTTGRCNLCVAEKLAIIRANRGHHSTKDPSLCRSIAMRIAITCATFHLQYPEACI